MIGAPGMVIWLITTPARDSADDWTMAPARVMGQAIPGKIAG